MAHYQYFLKLTLKSIHTFLSAFANIQTNVHSAWQVCKNGGTSNKR